MSSILDQYIRTVQTVAVGGTGSTKSYTLQSTQQKPPQPLTNLLVYTSGGTSPGSYITYLKATFADSSSGIAGTISGQPQQFFLSRRRNSRAVLPIFR